MGILGKIGRGVLGVAGSVVGLPPPREPFEIRVREANELFGETRLSVFVVGMRGSIVAPYDGYSATTELFVVDVTTGEKEPIISAIEELQAEDSIALGFSTSQEIPYQMSVINEWMTLVQIPIDTLTFPRDGQRKIEFFVHVGGTSASSKTTITYTCSEPGYLDARDNRKQFDARAVELAFSVSASDGDVDRAEAAVIKSWIQKRVALASGDEKETVKGRLNRTITEAYETFHAGRAHDVRTICENLKKVSTTAERYEALELCLQVAKADGIAEQDELEMLEGLAEFLELDKEKFRSMKDKHLTVSMMKDSDVVDVDQLLGLRSDMSLAEKKRHLREEFKKWNQLSEHKDPEKRKQAKKMLDLIGQKRAELKNAESTV